MNFKDIFTLFSSSESDYIADKLTQLIETCLGSLGNNILTAANFLDTIIYFSNELLYHFGDTKSLNTLKLKVNKL